MYCTHVMANEGETVSGETLITEAAAKSIKGGVGVGFVAEVRHARDCQLVFGFRGACTCNPNTLITGFLSACTGEDS